MSFLPGLTKAIGVAAPLAGAVLGNIIMPGAGGAIGGALGSALGQTITGNAAAKKQQDAATAATAAVTAQQQPYTDAGKAALARLSTGAAPGGQFSTPFSMADASNTAAMDFAKTQGLDAIQKSAAAHGGLLGTNAQQAGIQFAEQNAAQYQNQAFNQWLSSNQQQIGMNQSLAGLGQSSATQVGDVAGGAAMYSGGAAAGATANAGTALGGALTKLAGDKSVVNDITKLLTPSPEVDMSIMDSMDARASDARLKDDIKRVGYTDDGMPIYTYRMKTGGPKQMGVMAQHMEQTKPEAVSRGAHGFRMVDYDKVS